jgi:Cu+-exporting ATPase
VASPGPAAISNVSESGPNPLARPDDIVTLDPVCGMTVDPAHARHLAEHDGVIYAFCSMGCRTSFVREPLAWLASGAPSAD